MVATDRSRLTFLGHACIAVEHPSGWRLCIDPFPEEGFAGHSALDALPDTFTHALATHDHLDHAAFHAVPSARRIGLPAAASPGDVPAGLLVESRLAPHDEYGGRLRGGLVHLVRLVFAPSEGAPPVVLLHAGDLGEVPAGPLLAWLRERPVDVLLLPVGGHYVLSPSAALETAHLVRPRCVVPLHARDQGIPLPVMEPLAVFLGLTPHAPEQRVLDLTALPPAGSCTVQPLRPARLRRPAGAM